MAKAARARGTATPRSTSLPDEVVFWEILVRLPPKSLFRCRCVCRAWQRVTSARDFLQAHHVRQPSLPIFSGEDGHIVYRNMIRYYPYNLLAFDHTAAIDSQLHAIAQFDRSLCIQASCDGLLVLFKSGMDRPSTRLSICNPATREHAPLGLPRDLDVLGMYSHHPTNEYRLLLHQRRCWVADQEHADKIGCCVFALGSDQPARYIGRPEVALGLLDEPVQMRDSLHWCLSIKYPSMYESKVVVVFDTVAESFRHMRAPIATNDSYLFEIDGTLGIHSASYAMEIVDIWVLQNYESEVWDLKYRIKLPVAKIRREIQNCNERWDLNIVSTDGSVLLLVKVDGWVLHVDIDGKLVNSFNRYRRGLYMSRCRLKQSLVQQTFFLALEGYNLNASPFI